MENISFNSNNILNINAILHNLISKLNFKFELDFFQYPTCSSTSFLSSGKELLYLALSVGRSVGQSVGQLVGRSFCPKNVNVQYFNI